MKFRNTIACLPALSVLAGLLFSSLTHAQYRSPYPPQAAPQAPPPLWVRIPGPAGMQVTFYRSGATKPSTLTTPATIALRPGYVQRIKVSNIPGYPGLVLFPTLEVRGSLHSEPKFKAKDHPAALNLKDADFEAVLSGGYVTRVIALERRKEAIALATTAEDPLQISVTPGDDPVREASRNAIPFLVVRMGGRRVSENELKAKGLPGTVWLPGDKSFPMPAVKPWLPWACLSLFDPRLGPRTLWDEYCLPDGGDAGPPAGLDFLGRLRGFGPSDTVAEFTDYTGKRRLACSNRICICVPRFLVFRGEVNLDNRFVYNGTSDVKNAMAHFVAAKRIPAIAQHQNVVLESVGGKQSASSTESVKGTVIFGQIEGVDVKAAVEGIRGVSSQCLTLTGEPPRCPLILIKWPDRSNAQIGDVLTMTLKYTNRSKKTLRNVAISDNLITRFQYVDGSSRSDRPTNFTTQPNDNGSHILRWEIVGDLPAGESGMVTFKVRVR